jgi:hypothetical protein
MGGGVRHRFAVRLVRDFGFSALLPQPIERAYSESTDRPLSALN